MNGRFNAEKNSYDPGSYYLHICQIARGNPCTSRRVVDGPSLSFYFLKKHSVLVSVMGEKFLCILQGPCLHSRLAIESCFPDPRNCRLGPGLQRIARQEFFPRCAATLLLKTQNPSNSVHDGSATGIRPKPPTLHRHGLHTQHRAAVRIGERPQSGREKKKYTRRYVVMFLRSSGQFIPHAGFSSFRRTS